MRFTYEDLSKRYSELTASVFCKCVAVTPLVGGLTAGDAGLRAFIKHHLGITDETEAEKTLARIKTEELGDKPIPSETGELNERLTYGVNIIRKTEHGPYLGNWMIHANIKTSASRLGIFADTRGSKGNMAEGGVVIPWGTSKRDDRPDCVYLVDADGNPVSTYFDEFKGKISGPSGSVSVMHHSECVPAGTFFSFEFKFLKGKLRESDVRDILALSMIVGIGSVKSLGHGKFRIIEADILEPADARKKASKSDVPEVEQHPG